MAKRRRRIRCACCGTLFFPDPRQKGRQRYCPQPACRRARDAARQARFRQRHPEYARGRKLREVLSEAADTGLRSPKPPDPLAGYPWRECLGDLELPTVVVLVDLMRFMTRHGDGRWGRAGPDNVGHSDVTVKVRQASDNTANFGR